MGGDRTVEIISLEEEANRQAKEINQLERGGGVKSYK
jgi:hypothetical protein